ncbi:MAG: hypothetical protein IPI67_14685 [Myxococcales bacterium]|nr:hypothetical protein [Myxococcales bacterium]
MIDASSHDSPEARGARRWLLLGVASLLLSGVLAALLVVARAPVFARFISDPAFFRRCLVVHVDLSLLVWVYAFAGALLFLLPRAGRSSRVSRAGVYVGAVGVLMLLLAAGAPGAQPILANYVPVIDHWLFTSGLVVFAAGVLMSAVDRRLWPSEPAPGVVLSIPAAAVPGIRTTGIALIIAALTFAASWLRRPTGLEPTVLYELGNWGGGHVLQLTSAAAMLSVWLILLAGVLGRSPVSRNVAAALFALLLLPWTAAPLLGMAGMQDVAAREGFTLLMRWGIFPPAAILLILCLGAVRRGFKDGTLSWRDFGDVRLVGFFASAGLTTLGWILGALIRGSTTVIPAHYHASIGGVTVAFMALSFPLLEVVGVPVRASRLAKRAAHLQPALFGVGQSIFAIGFALAGAHGMGRKLYGAEQNARSLAQKLGLSVMGLGGLLAIVAGVLFLAIVVSAYLKRERAKVSAWELVGPGSFLIPAPVHDTTTTRGGAAE